MNWSFAIAAVFAIAAAISAFKAIEASKWGQTENCLLASLVCLICTGFVVAILFQPFGWYNDAGVANHGFGPDWRCSDAPKGPVCVRIR